MKSNSTYQQIIEAIKTGTARGTQTLHTLPSLLITLLKKRTNQNVYKSNLEFIIGSITVSAELLAYNYLARKGIPAYWLPLATNFLDIGGYIKDKIDQGFSDDTPDWAPVFYFEFDLGKIDWRLGASFERWFHSFYHRT